MRGSYGARPAIPGKFAPYLRRWPALEAGALATHCGAPYWVLLRFEGIGARIRKTTTLGRKRLTMTNNIRLAILVSALGYFVDVYDLILFSILRVSSLTDLGYSGDELVTVGSYLLNMQMAGFLVGGVLWGVIGDKIGRIELLFGSILLYSVGNILNGFVGQFGAGVDSIISPIDQYAWLRFFTGIGLAGEIGGGITLVSELLPKKTRGYGTTIVVATGVAGAVVAALVSEFFSWRAAYIVGGVMGLCLLALRLSVAESGIFKAMASQEHIARGNFFMLFTSWDRFGRYAHSILVGLPIWYSLAIVVTFSPELAVALGISEPVITGTSVFWFYLGITIGSVANGLLSQWLQSRKRAVAIFLGGTLLSLAAVFHAPMASAGTFYSWVFVIGFFTAYWAMLVTVAAEQFGTNLRATVATSVPNFVRGATVPIVALFAYIRPEVGIVNAAEIVGVLVAALALYALVMLRETFSVDLDYVETDANPAKQNAS
jgi:MFS transporter, putative metabolite:H+ symporter